MGLRREIETDDMREGGVVRQRGVGRRRPAGRGSMAVSGGAHEGVGGGSREGGGGGRSGWRRSGVDQMQEVRWALDKRITSFI